jgi:hypothetical protein
MWPVSLAALLAGCQFEPVGALPDDGAPPVPPDVSADAGVDAPPPDAAPDEDGDTIPDADDNCPDDPNTDQANCDGDALGDACDPEADGPDADGDDVADACDNCPSESNADQSAVLDDDAVGDACDPRPTEGGDTIAYFSGFDGDSGAQPPGWSLATGGGLINGQWRVEAGRLVHDASADVSILYLSGQDVPADVVVETRFSVSTFVPSGSSTPVALIGVLSRYGNGAASGGQDAGYLCQLEQGIGGDPTAAVLVQDLAGTRRGSNDAPWSGRLDQSYTITHSQTGVASGATSGCTVTPPAPDLPESVSVDDIPGPDGGRVAVRTQRIGAAFDYILVYGLGGPLAAARRPASHPAP